MSSSSELSKESKCINIQVLEGEAFKTKVLDSSGFCNRVLVTIPYVQFE